MSTSTVATYSAITVPTQFVETNGIRFAYRCWGKQGKLPLVFNQHFTGNLDNWDPAVLDGLADEREVIIFNNAGVASSSGEVPSNFGEMGKNAILFIESLGLKQIDLLGFSIGGFVAQEIVLARPDLVRKLVLVGTGPRNQDVGDGQNGVTAETASIVGATYNPPENIWLKMFFTDSEKGQAAGREFLKRYMSRTKDRICPSVTRSLLHRWLRWQRGRNIRARRFSTLKTSSNLRSSSVAITRSSCMPSTRSTWPRTCRMRS